MKNSVHFAGRSLILMVFILSMSLASTSCSKDNSDDNTNPNPAGNKNEITMQGSSFSPGSLSVTAGTKVTWRNNDSMNHTVTSDNALFDSGTVGPGGSYSFTFTAIGTYSYHCNFHAGMTGVVVVN